MVRWLYGFSLLSLSLLSFGGAQGSLLLCASMFLSGGITAGPFNSLRTSGDPYPPRGYCKHTHPSIHPPTHAQTHTHLKELLLQGMHNIVFCQTFPTHYGQWQMLILINAHVFFSKLQRTFMSTLILMTPWWMQTQCFSKVYVFTGQKKKLLVVNGLLLVHIMNNHPIGLSYWQTSWY